MGYTYRFPRPMVTVDTAVFRITSQSLEVLVIRRKNSPFSGELALPGGFVDMDEDLLDAATRELFEETGLKGVRLEQLAAFGKPGRDPRGRNISIAFVGVLEGKNFQVCGGDDASEALWVPARRCPTLAFDHFEMLRIALKWFDNRDKKTI
ncbi:MAG: NUDIX hydrolase [Proteobacteria bacterium]|nr:NUDIX hydrolase [Pseudomonadota bacterium]